MARPEFEALRQRYSKLRNHAIDPMGDLLKRYQQYRNTRALDLAAVALALGTQPQDIDTLDPLAVKALQDTNPNFDPSAVGSYSDEQWIGIVNSAKGKYFEYLVVDELNAGGTVGDLTLPDGYTAHLATSMTQPGWDLRIADSNGQVAELLQLKATDSIAYLRDTLERYPDIQILTTDEVASGLPGNQMVLNSQMSENELEQAVNAAAGHSNAGYLDEFWDAFNPLIPLLLVVATQGYQVVVNKQQVAGAMEVAKARAARSLVAGGVGAALKTVSGSWLLSALGAITAGMFFDRSHNIDELVNALRARNRLLASRVRHYQTLAQLS